MGSYLSKDREHLATQQRQRRARLVRIDYTPSAEALAAIAAKRGRYYPLNTNSGVINAIVSEWTQLTGINNQQIDAPMSPENAAGISRPFRAGAYDFGLQAPAWAEAWLAANRAKQASRRVICGARRHRDGQPCRAMSEPGKRRCRFHGGRSTPAYG
ncbi:MAG TPA: HGGxSTG domain-containing protein [Candidatus Binatia bacterium]|jgi:hypothetical protein|nr:HGGxSTG domain-containing protein [Candidatus Binatia bacterium]